MLALEGTTNSILSLGLGASQQKARYIMYRLLTRTRRAVPTARRILQKERAPTREGRRPLLFRTRRKRAAPASGRRAALEARMNGQAADIAIEGDAALFERWLDLHETFNLWFEIATP